MINWKRIAIISIAANALIFAAWALSVHDAEVDAVSRKAERDKYHADKKRVKAQVVKLRASLNAAPREVVVIRNRGTGRPANIDPLCADCLEELKVEVHAWDSAHDPPWWVIRDDDALRPPPPTLTLNDNFYETINAPLRLCEDELKNCHNYERPRTGWSWRAGATAGASFDGWRVGARGEAAGRLGRVGAGPFGEIYTTQGGELGAVAGVQVYFQRKR